jgi:predicted nucleic acid-binding Zn ribbon protein
VICQENILTQVTSDEKKRDRKTMILIKSIFSILLISFVECLFYFGSTLEEMRKGLH